MLVYAVAIAGAAWIVAATSGDDGSPRGEAR
jgi:hypothetical protein